MVQKMILTILYLVLILVSIPQPIAAENNIKEKKIKIEETKYFRQTEITLKHIVISENKVKVQFKLKGKQVEDLISGKKRTVYLHESPIVKVLDDKWFVLQQGTLEQETEQKNEIVLGTIQNISDDTMELTSNFRMPHKLPKHLTIQVIEFGKEQNGNENAIAVEFKIEL